jgi:hypothetical protein
MASFMDASPGFRREELRGDGWLIRTTSGRSAGSLMDAPSDLPATLSEEQTTNELLPPRHGRRDKNELRNFVDLPGTEDRPPPMSLDAVPRRSYVRLNQRFVQWSSLFVAGRFAWRWGRALRSTCLRHRRQLECSSSRPPPRFISVLVRDCKARNIAIRVVVPLYGKPNRLCTRAPR